MNESSEKKDADLEHRHSRWRNQYIDRIAQSTAPIFSLSPRQPPEEKLAALREYLKERRSGLHGVICELGSGSGGHLIERARLAPGDLFVGFELRYKRAFKTTEKAARAGISNYAVLRTGAELLPQLFEPNSLAGVYVNFPDPWEKSRWRKHRLLNQDFLSTIASRLVPGGFFSYKTDHGAYFAETVATIKGMNEFSVVHCCEDLHNSPFLAGNVATEFELLFKSQGTPICYAYAQKIGGESFPGV